MARDELDQTHTCGIGCARRRLRIAVVVGAVLASFAAFGAVPALAGTSTSTSLGLSATAVGPGDTVTLTATVTAAVGIPIGVIRFTKSDGSPVGPAAGIPVTAVPGSLNSANVSFNTSFVPGTYIITASFVPDDPVFGFAASNSTPQTLTVSSNALLNTQTTVTVSPATIQTGNPVTLTATVVQLGAPGIPTGTVSFTEGGVRLGDGTLDASGVATLIVPSFPAGHHVILASYLGSTFDKSSGGTVAFDATDPNAGKVQTTTHVTVSPDTILAGDTVTITATVVQTSDMTSPPPGTGDTVEFTADGGLLGDVPLVNGVATLVKAGWIDHVNPYDIRASYFGNISAGASHDDAQLTVLPAVDRVVSLLGYQGDASGTYGATATLSALLTDISGLTELGGADVTFTLDGQSCTATTDDFGVATCTVPITGAAGMSEVDVSYGGDLYTLGATTTAPFTVVAAPTTITVALVPGATTSQLQGTLLDGGGHPLVGETVSLSLGAATCSGVTNAAGLATCTAVNPTGSTALLSAAFAGDSHYAPSSASLTVGLQVSTTLAYTGVTTADFHDAALLAAKLVDGNGVALVGQAVSLSVGTQTCVGVTLATGVASCSVTLSQPAGTYPIAVSFAGLAPYLASLASGSFTVTREQNTLATSFMTSGAVTTLSATLLEDGVTPIAGRSVTLTLGASPCTTTTNAAGVATCSVATPTGTSTTLTATFAGDTYYLPVTTTKTVSLLKPTTLTYSGDTVSDYHDPALLSGKLVDALGNALSGQTVTFTLGTQSCSATTNSSGKASCLILFIAQQPGSYTATMKYAGTSAYAPSTASAPFTITREDTTLLAQISDVTFNSSSITLSAVLLEDHLLPIANRTVTLTLGHASCTDATNFLGFASCTVPRASSLGPSTLTATFAGDAYYLPATATHATLLCSFPSGGSFVIGDRNNSGSVTFWGSQWSKQNRLSHGDAPSAFKGWASGSFDGSWNGDWTTDPGNSATPPGQLPTYMAVIQTSSSSKYGSRISGDSPHIVVVKTDAGYAPSPGHAGTGTIVATVR